jgi:hypothetical protein
MKVHLIEIESEFLNLVNQANLPVIITGSICLIYFDLLNRSTINDIDFSILEKDLNQVYDFFNIENSKYTFEFKLYSEIKLPQVQVFRVC